MKRVVVTLLCAVTCTGAAYADEIAVFSDPSGTSVYWTDVASGLQQVYVYHRITAGATAADWQLYPPATWTHLGDICDIWCVGRSIDGISIPYEACLTGRVRVLTVNFMGAGLEPPCTSFYIGGFHGKPNPLAVDCAEGLYPVPGGRGFVNWDESCPPVPVESTTWGRIKALYQ